MTNQFNMKIASHMRGVFKGWLPLVAVPVLFLGLVFLIPGLISVAGMMVGGAPDTTGVWALIVLSFFSGQMYQQYTDEIATHRSSIVVENKGGEIRTLLGFAIFCLSLIVESDLLMYGNSTTWQELMRAMPNALLAWGAYVVIIQAPWSTSVQSSVEQAAHPKTRFSRYHIEKKENENTPWIRIRSLEGDYDQLDNALSLMQATSENESPMAVRVIKESGVHEIHSIARR